MIRVFISIVFILGSIGSASSATVKADSGQHEGFIRLVFPYRSATKWEIETSERRSLIIFGDKDLLIDTSSVFEKIPRNRLLEVKSTAGNIDLTLACDCVTEVFIYGDQYMVIDILDGLTSKEVPSSFPPIASVSEDNVAVEAVRNRTWSKYVVASEQGTAAGLLNEASIAYAMSDAIASGGLIASGDLATPRADVTHFYGSEQMEPKILVRSQLRLGPSLNEDICQSRPFLDPRTWPKPANLLQRLGELRSRVISEDGDWDEDQAERLAEAYIILGYGAEARSVLEASEIVHSELFALARIMDGELIDKDNPFADSYECTSSNALWAILATRIITAGKDVNVSEVFSIITDMEIEHREKLAPLVYKKFLASGLDSAAASVRAILDRSLPTVNGLDHSLVEVSRTEGVGSGAGALPLSARQVLKTLSDHLSQGVEVSDETLETAKLLVPVVENDNERSQLVNEILLAELFNGKAWEAAHKFRELVSSDGDGETDFHTRFLNIVVNKTSDNDFAVIITFIKDILIEVDISDALRDEIIYRSYKIGINNISDTFLGMLSDDKSDDAKSIRGMILMMSGYYADALLELSEVSEVDAYEMRIRSLMATGNYGALLSIANPNDDRFRIFQWLSQPNLVAEGNDEDRAVLVKGIVKEVPSGTISLERSFDEMNDSEKLRLSVISLIGNH
jgi:hypothetical protein